MLRRRLLAHSVEAMHAICSSPSYPICGFCSQAGPRERGIVTLLRSKLEASRTMVEDISGGCGSMYKIEVESPLFRGKPLVAQHKMVKDALREEIADMHGLTLHTKPSPTST